MSFFYLASNGFSLPTQPTQLNTENCHGSPASQEQYIPASPAYQRSLSYHIHHHTHPRTAHHNPPTGCEHHLLPPLRICEVHSRASRALLQDHNLIDTHPTTSDKPGARCHPSGSVRDNQEYSRKMASPLGGSPTPTRLRRRRVPGDYTQRPSPSTPTPIRQPLGSRSDVRETHGSVTWREASTTGLPLIRGVVRPPRSRPSNTVQSSIQHQPVESSHSSYQSYVSTSSRRLSASYSTGGPRSSQPTTAYSAITASSSRRGSISSHPGPLTSHPTTAYHSITSSQSRGSLESRPHAGTLRMSNTCSNLPVSSTYQKDSRRISPTNIPTSKASIATSYATATALPRAKAENIPPSSSTANVVTYRENSLDTDEASLLPPQSTTKAKARSRGGIPKYRTLNVFSNLTASLSRTSLGTFTHNDSRHPSGASERTMLDTTSATPRPDSSRSNLASGPSKAPIRIIPDYNNPRQIHNAQPSEYWAGRFMALQDRFRSELLMPDNMNTLVSAHAERSMIGASQPPFGGGSLATSATTSCLSTSTATPKPVRRVITNTNTTTTTKMPPGSPRKQQQHPQQGQKQQATPATPLPGQQQKHKHAGANPAMFPKDAASSSSSSAVRDASEAAALLNDEDGRAHRVFVHLEALCATGEARRSLHLWQQGYARRTGKASLLPRGGTMDDRDRDGGGAGRRGQWRDRAWVARLLSSGSGGGGPGVKRGSFGF